MAIQKSTRNGSVTKDGACIQYQWALLANGDTGDWVSAAEWSGKTFQVSGTFGAGGSVSIQGSNDLNPTNAAILSNWQGTALTATAAGFLTARDMPIWVRPIVTAGDGTTSILVTLAAHRADIAEIG